MPHQYSIAIIRFGEIELLLRIHDFKFLGNFDCQTPIINSLLEQVICQFNKRIIRHHNNDSNNIEFTSEVLFHYIVKNLSRLIEHHYQTVVSLILVPIPCCLFSSFFNVYHYSHSTGTSF